LAAIAGSAFFIFSKNKNHALHCKDLVIHPIKNITQRSQGRRVEAGIARLSKKLIYESRQFKPQRTTVLQAAVHKI
jgi:hypothetical protein